MIDSLKTTIGSAGSIAINFMDIIPDVQSIIIGSLWIIYLYNKIRMEFK